MFVVGVDERDGSELREGVGRDDEGDVGAVMGGGDLDPGGDVAWSALEVITALKTVPTYSSQHDHRAK